MSLPDHLKRTFLTGIFAAIPLVTTAVAFYLADRYTEPLAPTIGGRRIPFLGLIVVVVGVYLLGLVVSTALASWFLARTDRLLQRVPGLQYIYRGWKQVSLSPGGLTGPGMWDKVVLVEVENGQTATLGFTSGQPLPDSPDHLVVFLPSAPLPTTGRLYVVPTYRCKILPDVTTEEAFKHLISGGNHVPLGLGAAARELMNDAR